jgi:hypothetical protein
MPTPWTTRVWQEFRAGNLTRAYRDCLLTLHSYRGPGGVAWPAHETLAARAGCCARTVQRALRQAADLDLVSWHERRRRAGWRWLRTSNLYRFVVPVAQVQAGMRPRFPCKCTTGQVVRAEGIVSKKEALQDMLHAAAQLPDLLAQRRAAVEARLLTGRQAGRPAVA